MPRYPLGRLAPYPESTHPRLKLGQFLKGEYAGTVPATVDYLSSVASWPVFLNDSIGDCTTAAAGHMEEAWSTYGSGSTVTVSDQDVLSMYEAVSGYNPNDPSTDQGAVMQDVLDYWRKTGLAGHRIAAFAQLDHTDAAQVKAALYLFGGIYVGVNFPASAMTAFDNGQPWDYDPNADNTIEGGHCVHLGLDDAGALQVTTWGKRQQVTQAWWDQFTEEAWVPISLEWLTTAGTAPEGLDVAALNAAFQEITGQAGPFPVGPNPNPQPGPTPNPPGPNPSPTPGPTPDPGPVVAADQQLAAAVKPLLAHLHHGSHAARQVADALITWLAETGL